MSAHDWIMQFLVGGMFGALGQGLRVVVGLKKLNDSALLQKKPFGELFSAGTLVLSLLIGAIAGVLGTLTSSMNLQAITRENVMLLIGIGYAGADFIEGFVRKELPAGAGATPDAAQAPDLPPVG
ncbi:MAG TPA: hypothetical protein VLU43_03435 [Anaeromyxobacteraceae bacterium]|nr:hypothetical protein [Anaeromyxobacteraceae bacterium]